MIRSWIYSVIGLTGFLLVSYALIIYALPLFLPFVLALLLAELVEPVVGRLTFRGKVPRSLAVAVVLLVVVGLMGFGLTAAIGRLVHEIQVLLAQLPELYRLGEAMVTRFADQVSAYNATLPEGIQEVLISNMESLQRLLSEGLGPVSSTLGYVTSLPMFLVNTLFFLIATFFISRDRRQIGQFLLRLFPSAWREQITQVRLTVWSSAMGFAKAMLLLISMTMTQAVVGLWIIGAPYPVLLGILIGVADILPLLGPGTILTPWAIYAMLTGNVWFGLQLLILYGILTSVRQMLEAKVVGEKMGIHPLAILISFYLGFRFFGAIGFVLGPLLAILLKAMIASGLLPIFQDDKPA